MKTTLKQIRAARAAAWAAASAGARDTQTTELRRVCVCMDSGEDPYPFVGVRQQEGAAA